jgi:hypothetical protein
VLDLIDGARLLREVLGTEPQRKALVEQIRDAYAAALGALVYAVLRPDAAILADLFDGVNVGEVGERGLTGDGQRYDDRNQHDGDEGFQEAGPPCIACRRVHGAGAILEDQAAYAAEADCKLHFADKITHRAYGYGYAPGHRMNTPQVGVIPFARSAMD